MSVADCQSPLVPVIAPLAWNPQSDAADAQSIPASNFHHQHVCLGKRACADFITACRLLWRRKWCADRAVRRYSSCSWGWKFLSCQCRRPQKHIRLQQQQPLCSAL